MGSEHGLTQTQLKLVSEQPAGEAALIAFAPHFDEATVAALAYADAMTVADVDDACFDRVAQHFDADQIVELTEVIAWENASARFNRALRVASQHLWHPDEGSHQAPT